MKSILLIAVVVPLVPMLVVSGIMYYEFQSSYNKKARVHLENTVVEGSRAIDRYLSERIRDLGFLAETFTADELRQESFLSRLLSGLNARSKYGFAGLVFLDAQGRQLAHAGSVKKSDTDLSDAGWLREVTKAGYIIREPSFDSEDHPQIQIVVSKPSRGNAWFLGSTLDFRAFSAFVKGLCPAGFGDAFIVNKNGRFLTAPLQRAGSENIKFSDFFGPGKIAGDKKPVHWSADNNGNKSVYTAARLENADWYLVHEQSAGKAFSGLGRARIVAVASVLIVSFLIAANAFRLSRTMVRRIEKADIEKRRITEQMFQTGKLASIGELAAGIAHEINNPVAIMVEEAGWIGDLLEEDEFQSLKNVSEIERSLKQIRTQGHRCKDITRKLLSFARKADSSVQGVQVKELVEDIVHIAAKRAKYAGVVVNLDIQEELPPIEVSPTELQQVFLNLTNNALDAMEEGKPGVLGISARLEKDNIVVEVSDNGAGIPEEDLLRIFDPFYTTKPVGKGTGLGLSICYGIIKKLGGDIHVNSFINQGTTFRVSIPLSRSGGGSSEDPAEHAGPYQLVDENVHAKGMADGESKYTIG
ncbi:MAG: two-component sensor histidine kinase [Deltaproteobacteria bacterium]|nr:two-component sensor histidine kinase [Deltaproteobacteria bacterium]